jgi:hypothetical protein
MEELNTTKTVDVIDEAQFDTLTMTDMGEAFAFSQIAEDGTLHNVVIGPAQMQAVFAKLGRLLG